MGLSAKSSAPPLKVILIIILQLLHLVIFSDWTSTAQIGYGYFHCPEESVVLRTADIILKFYNET